MRVKNGTTQKKMKKSHISNKPQSDLRLFPFSVIPTFEENLYNDM